MANLLPLAALEVVIMINPNTASNNKVNIVTILSFQQSDE